MAVGSPDNRRIKNPLIGDELVFITLSSESEGACSIVEVTLQPGGESVSHLHHDITEKFIALSGTLGVVVSGNEKFLQPNESYTIHPNVAHKYFNPTESVIRFRVEITPGSRGFEQFLQIAYGLAEDRLTTRTGMPINPIHIGVLLDISDTHLPGAIRFLEPVVRLFSYLGVVTGVRKKLIEKYCNV